MKSIVAISRSARQARNAIAVRGGGGGPLARPEPPSQPLAEQDEMTWDDGTTVPEPCLDDYTQVTRRYALTWLAGGLLSFAALGALTTASHPESRRPFVKEKQLVYVPKESPGL
mmetsp:Transcript_5263/g.10403  ORF Transcript_5263/g.10403 Transcript_5263/m.10403 type:complete len:114 (+) Transcript_5263:165-506(+)|eukprot:CAMPEP_0118799474 /NCGR_PEP_ID=MMETSP1161-20130426/1682_1 /TAXON_ID=249345 /ORGANISM="Picochlorum oklahomensis, Strain CCMP2329" /LENGTH=113 /DNA_ID=CAMNT_0006727183 /DNA_START=152 /DNA_END=493 /DNA_ORIENTATION=-